MANIELDGLNKKIKVDSGDLTLDVPGDIVLDADGGDITFADGGTNLLKITNSSSDVVFQPQVDTKDIVFKQYDGTVVATVEDNATFNVPTGKLAINGTAITSTAAELNILDGVTATAAELNLIDGVTATTAELNILDGVTSTASELNLLDGGTSVGGSITLADADGVVVNDGGTMKTIPASDIKTYTGGGGLVYVGGGSTTSNTAAITLDNVFSATYDNYLLVFDMTSNENGDAILHFRSAGGSPATQTGSNYRYAFMGLDTGGGSETSYGNDNSNFQMGHGMYDHEELDFPAMSGFIYFNSPFSSSHVKSFNGNFHNRASNGETRGFAGGGLFNNQVSCGGVRLSFSSGSVNNGTVRMYGMVNS